MRIIANIPHDRITINVFSMNDKYQVQLLAGNMEQTFKFAHSEVNGVDGIKKLLDETFIEKALERFNEMYLSMKEAKSRYSE
jgi:hypothetical protein